ncbi:MAG TPA: protein kinase, partial [Thermoanaerobaculia bacterium]
MLGPGQILRQYRIERFLDKGGMGEVYLATDTKLHRRVALKLLSPDEPIDERRKKRFVREGIAASRLTHPNISVVYDADETEDGVAFISMEYIEGETLAARLRRGPLPLDDVRSYALQIADALDEAHRRGIIHRDIKPGNVMIDHHGRVKILDFGLARVFEEDQPVQSVDITASAASAVVGTPPYMSPEQVRGERIDHRSDIFSFGVLLYEMITGQSPFAAPSVAMVAANILKTQPPSIRDLRREVTPELEQIVTKAMEKDRDLRYQSAREIAVDLQRPAPASSAKRWWRGAATLVVIAVAVVAAILFVWKRSQAPSTQSIDSIAVLPFQSLTPKPEGDYLADGMTEALIANLAQIRALKVISRTSVMQYKKTQKSLPQIGRELGAATVIEGSILQAGEQVRVTAQLIDARTDRHLWAQSYDRDVRDVLRLQDEIARMVADQVRVQLLPAEKHRLTRSPQIHPRAHELYLRARYDWNSRVPEAMLRSVDLLNEAIRIEPAWPIAYAALADSYNLLANNGVIAHDDGFPKGKNAARKALELDPDLGQAHAAMAFVLWQYDWDRTAADAQFRRAIDLQPSYAAAHHFYALFLVAFGRDAEGFAKIRKALQLDPLAPRINTNYGDMLRVTGREAEGVAQLQKWVAADPNQARTSLILAFAHLNKPSEAMKVANDAAAAKQRSAKVLQALALACVRHKEALPFIH